MSGDTYTYTTASSILPMLQQADVIIDETYAADPTTYTYSTFLQALSLTRVGL